MGIIPGIAEYLYNSFNELGFLFLASSLRWWVMSIALGRLDRVEDWEESEGIAWEESILIVDRRAIEFGRGGSW